MLAKQKLILLEIFVNFRSGSGGHLPRSLRARSDRFLLKRDNCLLLSISYTLVKIKRKITLCLQLSWTHVHKLVQYSPFLWFVDKTFEKTQKETHPSFIEIWLFFISVRTQICFFPLHLRRIFLCVLSLLL